ncbi:hypothetical protein yberc0001_26940 [Yersinia bercovieri ATCC 43970]|uniref:Uncharacterized protein n=1 Tax=Yersinia bercovieri ATCC 43970 TaxID=349968 RepID=A0ABM9XZF8_YERBE|nr:hypothetical protein yberc0001_26940 [Yersinia bercovieri ATCC 43970]
MIRKQEWQLSFLFFVKINAPISELIHLFFISHINDPSH